MQNNIINTSSSEKFFIKGLDFFNRSDYKNAKENFEISIEKNYNNIQSLYYLAVINTYYDFNNELAIQQLKKALALDPDHTDSTFLLSWNFFNANLSEEGIAFFKEKQFFSKQILFGVAYIYYLRGEFEKSLNLLEEIKKLDKPTKRISYLIYFLLGSIFYEQSKLEESLNCFNEALAINPLFARGFFLRAKIYKFFGNTELAISDFNKCYEIDINNLNSLIENLLILPHIYIDNDQFNRFRNRYFDGLEYISKNINNSISHSDFPDNQVFHLAYGDIANLELLKKKTKIFRKIFTNLNHFSIIKERSSSKIKIGFISEFLTDHTIGKLFSGLINNLDKKNFEVFVFHSCLTKEGKIKSLIDNISDKSIKLSRNFNEKIVAVDNEKLDIIFYPDIGMSTDLYYLTYLRIAKIQMNSWGHPETSGNSTIDYFVSSKICETENAQDFYSEKLINFNNFTTFYEVPDFNKKFYNVKQFGNFNIYFCSQSLFKILPDFDLILKKILDKDKKALIVFIKDQWNVWYKILLNRWKKSIKVNIDRIKFIDRLSVENFINLSGASNVLLDPIYFGSGNSFIETFSYGTPMVTFPNNFLKSRLVMGLYQQMRINQPPVVNSVDEYVNVSIDLATNTKKNQELRYQIIENSKKFFFRNNEVINEFEDFFIKCVNSNA
jgi:predicted O-linked N-acetylglucosamine transferase (SPINDLY family)